MLGVSGNVWESDCVIVTWWFSVLVMVSGVNMKCVQNLYSLVFCVNSACVVYICVCQYVVLCVNYAITCCICI